MSGFAQVAPCGYDDWYRVEADERGYEQEEEYVQDLFTEECERVAQDRISLEGRAFL